MSQSINQNLIGNEMANQDNGLHIPSNEGYQEEIAASYRNPVDTE